MILYTTHPIGEFQPMKGKLPTMDVAIRVLKKNRYEEKDFTYEDFLSGGTITEDVWLSKLKGKTVHAVMFTHGKKIRCIWDSSIGKWRDMEYRNLFVQDELYTKFRNQLNKTEK